jgi:uncharacterized protein YqeY
MTTLKETLKADLTTNLKARNELAVTTLRSVIGAIQTQEKAGKTATEFDESKVKAVLAKELKNRRDSAVIYADAGATDRADRETAEADFLAVYLPTNLTDAEVEALVIEAIDLVGATSAADFGKVMKVVVTKADGRADGKTISTLVRTKLNS